MTTTALLLSLFDLSKANACPSSRTLELLREHLYGRWAAVATARAQYLAGERYQESPLSDSSSISEPALRALRLARMLAHESEGRVLRLRYLLGAILLDPALPEATGAQQLLATLGVRVELLRGRCPA